MLSKKSKILSIVSGVVLTATIATAGVAASGAFTPQQLAEVDISSAVSEGLQQISEATQSAVSQILNIESSIAPSVESKSQTTTPSQSEVQQTTEEKTFDLSGKSIANDFAQINFTNAKVNYAGEIVLSYVVNNLSESDSFTFTSDRVSATYADSTVSTKRGFILYTISPKGTYNAIQTFYNDGADVSRLTFTYKFSEDSSQSITFDFPR